MPFRALQSARLADYSELCSHRNRLILSGPALQFQRMRGRTSFCPSFAAAITPPPGFISNITIRAAKSGYGIKAPRLPFAAACSGVACKVTPHCSEKALLELQPRELGVIRT